MREPPGSLILFSPSSENMAKRPNNSNGSNGRSLKRARLIGDGEAEDPAVNLVNNAAADERNAALNAPPVPQGDMGEGPDMGLVQVPKAPKVVKHRPRLPVDPSPLILPPSAFFPMHMFGVDGFLGEGSDEAASQSGADPDSSNGEEGEGSESAGSSPASGLHRSRSSSASSHEDSDISSDSASSALMGSESDDEDEEGSDYLSGSDSSSGSS